MDTVPFLLCELGAPLFTNLKGAGTYFMCIPAMNRRMYKTLVDITSAGVFCCHVAAERVLMESGVRREHRKESVDQIAAAMILQGYLDHLSMTKKEDGENNG